MAIEVWRQRYVFEPALPASSLPEVPASFKLSDYHGINVFSHQPLLLPPLSRPRPPSPSPPHIPFRYNPLHDLESLWWIAVYFIFKRDVDIDRSDEAEDKRRAVQRSAAEDLFYVQETRYFTMTTDRTFQGLLRCLPIPVQPIGIELDHLRGKLSAAYRKAEEKTDLIDHTAADGLHEEFSASFSRIVAYLHNTPVRLQHIESERISSGRKRPLDSFSTEYRSQKSPTPPRKKARHADPPPVTESHRPLTRSRAAILSKGRR